MDNESDAGDVLRYIDSFHLPIILRYNDTNLKKIQWFGDGIQVLIFCPSTSDEAVYFQQWPSWLPDHSDSDDSEAIETTLNPWDRMGDLFLGVVSQVAENYRGQMLFIHIPESEYHIYQLFRVSQHDGFLPEIIVVDMRSHGAMSRYQFSSYEGYEHVIDEATKQLSEGLVSGTDMTATGRIGTFRSSLSGFLDDFLMKKLKRTIISEDIDTIGSSSGVIKLVGYNFDSSIESDDIDIYFVAFIAPWCGHCKALEPVLDSLANHFATPVNDRVVKVGKVDATVNEIVYPGVQIFGYPTLYIFYREYLQDTTAHRDDLETCADESVGPNIPQSSIRVIEYNGPRTVKDIKKAIYNFMSST